MALLGLIHRTVLGLGPSQFQEFFVMDDNVRLTGRETERRHNRQLKTHRKGKFLDILGHSILGLADVYNLLPGYVVGVGDVSTFQKRLQQNLRTAAKLGAPQWQQMYSPRLPIYAHPLRRMLPTHNGNVATSTMGNANATKNDTVHSGTSTKKCINGWLSFAQ